MVVLCSSFCAQTTIFSYSFPFYFPCIVLCAHNSISACNIFKKKVVPKVSFPYYLVYSLLALLNLLPLIFSLRVLLCISVDCRLVILFCILLIITVLRSNVPSFQSHWIISFHSQLIVRSNSDL